MTFSSNKNVSMAIRAECLATHSTVGKWYGYSLHTAHHALENALNSTQYA